MKKIVQISLWAVFLFFSKQVTAQSFSNTTGGTIPDNALTYFSVNVSGLPNTIDSVNFGLKSVCVNITHAFVGQLDIILRSPNGILVKLTNNRGSNGRNFTNTCFQADGTLPIQAGVAPFLGTFIPDEPINWVNRGINPNGVWQVGVLDEIPFVTGRLTSFTLSFGNNPVPTPVISLCTVYNGFGCKCPDGTQNCDLLPDMTNSSLVIRNNHYDEPGTLHIGVGTPNIGFGPLEMKGTGECFCDTVRVSNPLIPCPDGSYPKEKVLQRIYKKAGSVMSFTDRFAGYMEYHPSHGHIHIENWTSNTLRIKGPQTNPLLWPIIGRDVKVSFCLVNNFNCSTILGYCEDANGNALSHSNTGNPGMGIATGCNREQGIFPGYLDIYFPGYDGQELKFDSSTICNGVYYVVSVTDPNNAILEINKNNNVSVVPVSMAFQKNGDCCNNGFFADSTIGEAPFSVNFVDTTKPSSKRWLWDFGDGTTDTTQFPKHIYQQPGNYTVSLRTVADGTGCTSSTTKNKYIKVRPKATTVANPNNINVYPNPFTTVLNVYYNLQKKSTSTISILDAVGRTVYTSDTKEELAGIYEKTISPNKLPKGFYVVKVVVNNEVSYFKVVKQ